MKESKITISNGKVKVDLQDLTPTDDNKVIAVDTSTGELGLLDPASGGGITIETLTPSANNLQLFHDPTTGKTGIIATPPGASITASNSSREVGSATGVRLNYTATKNTNNITLITINGVAQEITNAGNTQSGTIDTTTPENTNSSYELAVKDSANIITRSTAYVNYYYARYYAALSTPPAELINTLNAGTKPSTLLNKELATSFSKNANYDCSGGKYIYILYLASYGTPVNVTSGGFAFSAFSTSNVTIKDDYSNSLSYKLMYTGIQNGSSVNLNIIN